LKEAVFARKLLGKTRFRMCRVRYTPRFVFQEVVLVRKLLGETSIGWAESDTPCRVLKEVTLVKKLLGETGIR